MKRELIQKVMNELEEVAIREHVPIIRKSERKLLFDMVKKFNPKRILEIGTAIGYSALLMLSASENVKIDTIEKDELRYNKAVRAFKNANVNFNVNCFLGDAIEVIPNLTEKYDFVYLDGPKGQYLKHLMLVEKLLSENAVIVADNVLFHGMVESDEYPKHKHRTIVMNLRKYLEYVKKEYITTIYKEGDGMAISFRKTK